MQKLLKVKEVAQQLGVDRSTVWRMRKTGCIAAVQLTDGSKYWRIPQSEVDRIVSKAKPLNPAKPAKPVPKLMPKAQRLALAEAAKAAAAESI